MLLMDTVADFAARDPFASVHGLVAYLDAEIGFNRGMAVAETSPTDSVKLMTVHTAKGLEWRGVLVPFLSAGVFPSVKGSTRWEWTARDAPWPLRGDSQGLPALQGWTGKAIDDYTAQCRAHAELEERRLVYVAVTRAKDLLVASGHWWGRTQVKPRGPSAYLSELGEHVDQSKQAAPWLPDAPPPGAINPVIDAVEPVAFPAGLDSCKVLRRRRAAQAVQEAVAASAGAPAPPDPGVDADAGPAVLAETGIDLAALDAEIGRLIVDAQATDCVTEVQLPPLLPATAVSRLRDDPEGFARELARPMPRQPRAAARFGTRFHRWVETTTGQQSFLDPSDLPGRASADIGDEDELAQLKEAFATGPFAERVPVAVEWQFTLLLGGHSMTGRIDAVYENDGGFEVVDWKTGRRQDGDPLQLAIYRLAWADAAGVPVDRVTAAFHYVRSGRTVRPPNLPGRAALESTLDSNRSSGGVVADA
jgi:DNA helicase-2/ATP-dependent DNA helicase PcrA